MRINIIVIKEVSFNYLWKWKSIKTKPQNAWSIKKKNYTNVMLFIYNWGELRLEVAEISWSDRDNGSLLSNSSLIYLCVSSLMWVVFEMPFISKDWRSPGEHWVKTEEGWEKKKVLECLSSINIHGDSRQVIASWFILLPQIINYIWLIKKLLMVCILLIYLSIQSIYI